jgi:hypothetical protein
MKWRAIVSLMTLLSISVSGCVQSGGVQKGYTINDDCLFCHVSDGPAGIRDVSRFYVNNEAHHKVGVRFPMDAQVNDDFHIPTGVSKDILYFDRNNNGRPDVEEIRVFVTKGAAIVTCASCHREHERAPVAREEPDDDYLRGTNANSEMCTTCHRK